MKAFFISSLIFLLASLGLFSFWTFRTFEDWRSQVSLESWSDEADRALGEIKAAYGLVPAAGSAAAELESAAEALDILKGRLGAAVHFEQTFLVGAVLGILELALVFSALGLGLWWLGRKHVFLPLKSLTRALETWDFRTELPLPGGAGTPEVRILADTLRVLQNRLADYEVRIRDAEREQVARFMVHQLKNRMTSLSLGTAVLEAGPPGTLPAQRSLKLIRTTLGDMERMLDQFRMVSRFPEPRKVPVQLFRLLQDTSSLITSGLIFSGPEDFVLEADPLLLKEALINLVQNAREAQGPENSCPVEAAWDDRSLEIRDSGPGFPPGILASQGRNRETTKQQGMGLGLAFAGKAAEAHGWAMVLENRPSGGGAVRFIWNWN